MIGSLVARVRELSLRVADLEGQLEAARRRIAVYEDFDAQVSDSLAAALRAANQIRQRAQVSADAIIAEARAARPAIVQELDAMRAERDALRKAIESAPRTVGVQPAATPAAGTFPMAEMRSAATEALRGVFKELVAEIRATAPPSAPAVGQAQTAVQTGEAVPPRPANVPAEPVAPQMAYAPPARPPAAPTPPPPSNITASAPVAQPAAPSVAPSQPMAPSVNVAPSQPVAPSVNVAPAQPRPAIIEEDEVAPRGTMAAPVVPAIVPAAAPAPAAHEDEWVPSNEAVGEIQVVLSPISSFPRLVELERRLQGMSAVRTVYARDFRNGVATLAVGLRQPMTVQEFAAAVTTLEYPRLRVVSTSGFVLELRIDTEASSIA